MLGFSLVPFCSEIEFLLFQGRISVIFKNRRPIDLLLPMSSPYMHLLLNYTYSEYLLKIFECCLRG